MVVTYNPGEPNPLNALDKIQTVKLLGNPRYDSFPIIILDKAHNIKERNIISFLFIFYEIHPTKGQKII